MAIDFTLAFLIYVLSWLPIYPDPYYHQDRMHFYEWLRRELNELQYGERARLEMM